MAANPVELGTYLRSRRAQRSPVASGLPAGTRRRTPGLRREELATLAGVSIDYLTRLEQGRHREPSAEVLAALANALGLDDHGRRHLFRLADRADPGPITTTRQHVPVPVRRVVERAHPGPAWVLNRRRDILVWNPAASLLFGDLDALGDAQRNQLRLVFEQPAARTTWVDWALVAQDTVALFREVTAPAAVDPSVVDLVDELRAVSADFDALWQRRDVARACSPGRVVSLPHVGRVAFDVELLDAAGGDLQIVLMEPHPASRQTWLDLVDARGPGRRLRAI